jgi:uncharacterized protein YbjT (DUF2867 family)
MKIVVIGGSGLIGTKVVKNLREGGHEVVAASPKTGVDTITGEGLAAALVGAQVVVDVANSSSFEAAAALSFFETAARNITAAEAAAGVGHHVALSVVGADRQQQNGYMRAKLVQEAAIKASKTPFTIVRATQFFEFIGAVVEDGNKDGSIRLTSALMQPIAAADVAAVLTEVALAPPVNGIVDIAGPDSRGIDVLGRELLKARKDDREIVTDVHADYFGADIDDRSLRPDHAVHIGSMHFKEWLVENARGPAAKASVTHST